MNTNNNNTEKTTSSFQQQHQQQDEQHDAHPHDEDHLLETHNDNEDVDVDAADDDDDNNDDDNNDDDNNDDYSNNDDSNNDNIEEVGTFYDWGANSGYSPLVHIDDENNNNSNDDNDYDTNNNHHVGTNDIIAGTNITNTSFCSREYTILSSTSKWIMESEDDDDNDDDNNDNADNNIDVEDNDDNTDYFHLQQQIQEHENATMTTTIPLLEDTATTTTATATSYYRTIADRAVSWLELDYQRTIDCEVIRQQQQEPDEYNNDNDNNEEEDNDDANNQNDVHMENMNNNADDDDDDDYILINNNNNNDDDDDDGKSISHSTNDVDNQPTVMNSPIDTESVRRVMQTIVLTKDAKTLQSKYQEWERQNYSKKYPPNNNIVSTHTTNHLSLQYNSNGLHNLIPRNPYMSFHPTRMTSKSRIATSHFTRSACIAEALCRLNIIQSKIEENNSIQLISSTAAVVPSSTTTTSTSSTNCTTLRIDVIGCDHVECQSEDSIKHHFGPIAKWIASYVKTYYTSTSHTKEYGDIDTNNSPNNSMAPTRQEQQNDVQNYTRQDDEKNTTGTSSTLPPALFNIEFNLIGPNIPQYRQQQQQQQQNFEGSPTTLNHPIRPVDLLLSKVNGIDSSSVIISTLPATDVMVTAIATCHIGVYDEWIRQQEKIDTQPSRTNVNNYDGNDKGDDMECTNTNSTNNNIVDLAISFNAGIWGYEEWKMTLQNLYHRFDRNHHTPHRIPFVITAYTIEEAEDDYDVIAQIVQNRKNDDINNNNNNNNNEGLCTNNTDINTSHPTENNNSDNSNNADDVNTSVIWQPECNIFASKVDRTIKTSPQIGRSYRENAAWQAWYI
jgi:hypothetical protein